MLPSRDAVPARLLPEPRWSGKDEAVTGSGAFRLAHAALPIAAVLGVISTAPGVTPAIGVPTSTDNRCVMVVRADGGVHDAGPALQACIDATPKGGSIALPPGRYLIATPVAIRRPLTLTTRGLATDAPPCSSNERRCAILHLAVADDALSASAAVMPFDVEGGNVRLEHLVFEGTLRTDPQLSARRCASHTHRPMGGGLRVSGDHVVIRQSTFRSMACYTALEYGTGSDVEIIGNDFIANGVHTQLLRWADGLTIHSATRFRIAGNRFRDNTDVQLILGGCVSCTITGNRFRHDGAASGGSFAELMLQAWPGATSGDFTDTTTTGNDIDCGPKQRCGFGIMIGSAPWYDAPAFGGSVVANTVRRAMLALDVDRLTGPMTIDSNQLVVTPGTYPSNCGPRRIDAAANVSPDSRRFLTRSVTKASAATYSRCILNYTIEPGPAPRPPQ